MSRNLISETRREQKRYDDKARWYDFAEWPMEALAFGRLRPRLWRAVTGAWVLEVGVGTGRNLPHYPQGARMVAVDLSPAMLRRAARKAARRGQHVDFLLADAERLPFRDAAFDTVVATCVFCSVPDPVGGLREVLRVSSPAGRLLLLEHVRAGNRVLGKIMDWLNPLVVWMGGENINRDTVSNVKAAGFTIEREESFGMKILKLLNARPNAPQGSPAGRPGSV
jgi:ubiquinone/menaquinone biosynthesis C-methylase UbiE